MNEQTGKNPPDEQPTTPLPETVGSVGSTEPVRSDEPQRTGPRSGPIVWGVLILVFCAWVLQRTVGTEAVDATTWLIGTLLGTGAVLLIVALGLILRRSR